MPPAVNSRPNELDGEVLSQHAGGVDAVNSDIGGRHRHGDDVECEDLVQELGVGEELVDRQVQGGKGDDESLHTAATGTAFQGLKKMLP